MVSTGELKASIRTWGESRLWRVVLCTRTRQTRRKRRWFVLPTWRAPPHLGIWNESKLVRKGSHLTVLSSTRYWMHVRLPNGKVGYITGNPYYVDCCTPRHPEKGLQQVTVKLLGVRSGTRGTDDNMGWTVCLLLQRVSSCARIQICRCK